MKRPLWSRWIQGRQSRRRARPGLEVLEDRTMPAVFNIGPDDVATLLADINTANSNGQNNVINLTASTYDLTQINNYWYGPNGLPAIANNLTIHGNGAVLQRDSNAPNFRLFYVSGGMELSPGSLAMDNVTLQGGIAKGGDSNHGGGGLGAGGAIFNQGTLNLTDVTLTNDQAIGGSSGVTTAGDGGGGMGQDAPLNGDGGGFGGSLGGVFGGTGGAGGQNGGGGGGGFLTGANGANATATAAGSGGGLGGFANFVFDSPPPGADGGNGGTGSAQATASGSGGSFGFGGGTGSGGGGGGVGGGGGAGAMAGGNGGFGGGGGSSTSGGSSAGGFGGGPFGFLLGDQSISRGGAGYGGAIFNMGADSAHAGSGQLTLVNCTLTNNIAQGGASPGGSDADGGALFNLDGLATLTNDTLVANSVGFVPAAGAGALPQVIILGGDIENKAFGNDIDTGNPVQATLILNNCILSNSGVETELVSSAVNGKGFNTASVNGGHNLVMNITGADGGSFPGSSGDIAPSVITLTANPMLGPLQYNGGLTPTMLPLPGSPILGAGDPSLAPATDQRGVPRPAFGLTDLGAVQVSGTSTGGESPPTLFQALLSLYLDAAVLELNNLAVEFIHGDNFNIDNYFGTPSQLAVVRANAAAAGVNYDAIEPLLAGLMQFTGRDVLGSLNDLHFEFPYGGPFAWFAIAAGSAAADQAVRL